MLISSNCPFAYIAAPPQEAYPLVAAARAGDATKITALLNAGQLRKINEPYVRGISLVSGISNSYQHL